MSEESAWARYDELRDRFEALASEYERHAGLIRAQEESIGRVDVIQRWRAFEDAALTIRRALDDLPGAGRP